jgi:fibronectin type 3 domain-containing protein
MRTFRAPWILVVALAAVGIGLFAYVYAQNNKDHSASVLHSATLKWSPSAGATSYNIYRGTVSGGPYTKVASTETLTYVDAPWQSGAVFYYVVTAVRGDAESAHSAEVKAAVP